MCFVSGTLKSIAVMIVIMFVVLTTTLMVL